MLALCSRDANVLPVSLSLQPAAALGCCLGGGRVADAVLWAAARWTGGWSGLKGNLGAGESALWFLRRGLVDATVGLAGEGTGRGTDRGTDRTKGGGKRMQDDDDRAQIKSLLDCDGEGETDGGVAAEVGVAAARAALAGWPEAVWREAQARRLLTR